MSWLTLLFALKTVVGRCYSSERFKNVARSVTTIVKFGGEKSKVSNRGAPTRSCVGPGTIGHRRQLGTFNSILLPQSHGLVYNLLLKILQLQTRRHNGAVDTLLARGYNPIRLSRSVHGVMAIRTLREIFVGSFSKLDSATGLIQKRFKDGQQFHTVTEKWAREEGLITGKPSPANLARYDINFRRAKTIRGKRVFSG